MQNLIIINKLVKMLKQFVAGRRLQTINLLKIVLLSNQNNFFKFDRGMNNLKVLI